MGREVPCERGLGSCHRPCSDMATVPLSTAWSAARRPHLKSRNHRSPVGHRRASHTGGPTMGKPYHVNVIPKWMAHSSIMRMDSFLPLMPGWPVKDDIWSRLSAGAPHPSNNSCLSVCRLELSSLSSGVPCRWPGKAPRWSSSLSACSCCSARAWSRGWSRLAGNFFVSTSFLGPSSLLTLSLLAVICVGILRIEQWGRDVACKGAPWSSGCFGHADAHILPWLVYQVSVVKLSLGD